jgi:hypothetical protein
MDILLKFALVVANVLGEGLINFFETTLYEIIPLGNFLNIALAINLKLLTRINESRFFLWLSCLGWIRNQ